MFRPASWESAGSTVRDEHRLLADQRKGARARREGIPTGGREN